MSYATALRQRAARFSALHRAHKLFILPNIWSVGSAYVFAKQGFPALATSSAGVAYDLGLPDGEALPFAALLELVDKISARVDVPLSVDFERGYGESGAAIQANARELLRAGAVGFNLEDGEANGRLSPLALQEEKIAALVELKRESGVNFVINARCDAYWLNVDSDEEKEAIAIERGHGFVRAGADCVFLPGPLDDGTAARLVRAIPAPLNLILNPCSGAIAALDSIGVRRLSLGSAPVRHIYGATIQMAEAIRRGDTAALLNNPFSYAAANEYFSN